VTRDIGCCATMSNKCGRVSTQGLTEEVRTGWKEREKGLFETTRPFQRVELSGLAYPPYWGVLITQFCTPDASKFSLFRGGPSCGQR
jgi:hypothetical protein